MRSVASPLAPLFSRLFPRLLTPLFALLLGLLVAGCGLLPEEADETAGWSANRLYSEAKNALNEGIYDKAIRYFERLEARYPHGRFAQQAQLEIAYAHFRQGDTEQALAASERFIRLHPNHSHIDYVYYLKGVINFNEDLGLLGHISMQDMTERDPRAARDSFEAFRVLVTRFPNSRYAEDARLRMAYLVNALASHEVHVARYYLRRGAYVAAVNRAQHAIQTYPNAPAIEEALFIMVRAYDQLGMNDLRDDADRVMRKNFPNSEFYKRGLERDVPWWRLW